MRISVQIIHWIIKKKILGKEQKVNKIVTIKFAHKYISAQVLFSSFIGIVLFYFRQISLLLSI